MYKLCQKVIHDANPSVSTYCMRPIDHKGKCSPEATEEDKKRKIQSMLDREIMIKHCFHTSICTCVKNEIKNGSKCTFFCMDCKEEFTTGAIHNKGLLDESKTM